MRKLKPQEAEGSALTGLERHVCLCEQQWILKAQHFHQHTHTHSQACAHMHRSVHILTSTLLFPPRSLSCGRIFRRVLSQPRLQVLNLCYCSEVNLSPPERPPSPCLEQAPPFSPVDSTDSPLIICLFCHTHGDPSASAFWGCRLQASPLSSPPPHRWRPHFFSDFLEIATSLRPLVHSFT